MKVSWCFILLFVSVVCFSGLLQAQTNEEQRIQQLEELCKKQQECIQNLQGTIGTLQSEDAYQQYTKELVHEYMQTSAAQEDDGITAGYENGFFIDSADRNFEFKLNGYFQAGIGIFENDTYDSDSFFLHGAYLMFDFRIMEKWHAFIKVNFAAGQFVNQFQESDSYQVKLADAFLEYNYRPELNFVLGNTLVPFTMEGQYAEIEGISIWQEPFINGWSHGLDVGFLVHGVIADRVGYRVGIFNSNGSNAINNDDDMLMAGQVRFYFCGYEKNKESFIHISFLRNRDARIHDSELGSAGLFSPWGRQIFDGEFNGAANGDETVGWRTAVNAGAKLTMNIANGSGLRLEGEFMYSTWEREFNIGWLPRLTGYGFWLGASYRHCLNKENEGSGIIVMGKFSYADIDNNDTDMTGSISGVPADIVGQTAYVYTLGLGYAFNKHIAVNFNWIIMNLDEKDYYGGPKNHYNDVSRSLEQAWFIQFTTTW